MGEQSVHVMELSQRVFSGTVQKVLELPTLSLELGLSCSKLVLKNLKLELKKNGNSNAKPSSDVSWQDTAVSKILQGEAAINCPLLAETRLAPACCYNTDNYKNRPNSAGTHSFPMIGSKIKIKDKRWLIWAIWASTSLYWHWAHTWCLSRDRMGKQM